MLASCLSGVAVADSAIYRYEDAQGIAVFAGRPGLGRQEVTLPAVNTYTPVASKASAAAPAEADAPGTYRSVVITAPGDGETLRRNGGNVRVTGRTEPELQAGHMAALFMDGSKLNSSDARRVRVDAPGQPRGDIEFAVAGVARGPHTLRIAILDQENNILTQSAMVSFHLLRASAGRRH